MSHPIWPLFDLRVRTPRLELRYVDDLLGEALATLAADGVHDPATMPFAFPWTDVQPPEQQRCTMQWYWRCRAAFEPTSWNLDLAVLVAGVPVGSASLRGTDFPVLRTFAAADIVDFHLERDEWERRLRRDDIGIEGLDAALDLFGLSEP
jgi:hypothetical protein